MPQGARPVPFRGRRRRETWATGLRLHGETASAPSGVPNRTHSMMDNDKSQEYERARAAFDALRMEERAAFLVESLVAMVADGVGEAGRVVQEVVDEMAEALDGLSCKDDDAGPAAAADAPPKAAPKRPARKTARPRGQAGEK